MKPWKDLWVFIFLTACTSLLSSGTGTTWGFEKLQVSVTTVIYLTLTDIVYKLLKLNIWT